MYKFTYLMFFCIQFEYIIYLLLLLELGGALGMYFAKDKVSETSRVQFLITQFLLFNRILHVV